MSQRTLENEAARCLYLAEKFGGRPEKAILLRIASEFQRLSDLDEPAPPVVEHDRPYFTERASQEISAAVQARHPKARLAHFRMAQHYEDLLHGSQA
jgi:hypothetical protein